VRAVNAFSGITDLILTIAFSISSADGAPYAEPIKAKNMEKTTRRLLFIGHLSFPGGGLNPLLIGQYSKNLFPRDKLESILD
jgi:hypothetical protein